VGHACSSHTSRQKAASSCQHHHSLSHSMQGSGEAHTQQQAAQQTARQKAAVGIMAHSATTSNRGAQLIAGHCSRNCNRCMILSRLQQAYGFEYANGCGFYIRSAKGEGCTALTPMDMLYAYILAPHLR
jgi:hypothetical protein